MDANTQQTHFADDATLARITELEQINADLLAALHMIIVNAGYESGEALPQLRELKVTRSCLNAARAAIAKARDVANSHHLSEENVNEERS